MLNREAVRDFVVNVLGCRCPESVFQTIEVQEGGRRGEGELNPLSGGFVPPDEKVHLHIIPKDQVPDSLA